MWFKAGVIAVQGHRLLGSFHHAGHVWWKELPTW